MKTATSVKFLCATALCLSLAACKSSEERAEESFQSALSLMEQGDPDRAIVELRNVFQLNGQHREARWTLAQLLLDEKNDRKRAYSQLLRLAEQYPDDAEVRILLSELAFEARNFDEFERHGLAAQRLSPEDARVEAITYGLEYREATLDEDIDRISKIAGEAEALLLVDQSLKLPRSIVIDHSVRREDFATALVNLDALIESNPSSRILQEQRLGLIARTGDLEAIAAQLLAMVEIFNDDNEIKATLLRFYLSNNQPEEAEGFLRNVSSPSDEEPGPFVDLIRFVAQTKGQNAALIEIERAIAENPNPGPFRALRASFWFSDGDEAKAIAELEDVIATSEDTEDLNNIKLTLAQMFITQDNDVGARRLIEEIIVDDQLNAEALKIRAVWHIEADDPDAAISDLRLALDSNSEDFRAMTIMSEAYTRLGSHDLARDFLALAADASNNAPEESIRYATRLFDEEQFLPAEDTLIASLRLNPGNLPVLQLLGRVYLALEDEPRTSQVIDTLRRSEDPNAAIAANALEAELVSRTDGTEEALAFLEQVAQANDNGIGSQLFLLRGRLAAGDIEGARSLLDTLLENDPDSISLRSVKATIDAVSGEFDSAETGLRSVLEDNPLVSRNWLELSRLLTFQAKDDEAEVVIANGLDAIPGDPGLLWARASLFEKRGDIDGAIEIYEELYAETSGAPVVANNLASLLATYRDDQESLDRAFAIARRLQGTEVPQFQDTIGWILHRRGEHQEAQVYLEQAAAALTDDAMTQFHLGMNQSALGQTEEAIEQLQKAIDLAGQNDERPQFLLAREEIIKLQNQ